MTTWSTISPTECPEQKNDDGGLSFFNEHEQQTTQTDRAGTGHGQGNGRGRGRGTTARAGG